MDRIRDAIRAALARDWPMTVRQVFYRLLEASLGALAQGALDHHHGNGAEDEGGHEGLDGGESEAEIGGAPDTEAGKRDEDVNESLHKRPSDSRGFTIAAGGNKALRPKPFVYPVRQQSRRWIHPPDSY